MHRYLKRTLIVIAVLLVIFIALGFVAGNYFYNIALNPAADRSAVLQADHNQVDPDSTEGGGEAWWVAGLAWLEESGYSTRQQTSEDGIPLSAYMVENEDTAGSWVVVCHGYSSNALTMGGVAAQFYSMGFNVLLPDARGHGESGGDYIGMGWPERRDIVGWLEMINEEYSPANLLLYGVSMGGATVLMTSGEVLPGNLRAIVADCGYTSAWDEFSYQLKESFGLPAFPVMYFSSVVARIRAGYWLGEASALKQVEKTRIPILFFHGGADTFVPTWMAEELYTAAGGKKELVIAEGAGHGASAAVLGEEYWIKIAEFYTEYFV